MRTTPTAFVLAAMLAGCALPPEDLELDVHDSQSVTASDAPDAFELGSEAETSPVSGESQSDAPLVACPGARLIGVLDPSASDCSLGGSLPSKWKGKSLFASGSPLVEPFGSVPPGLQQFCVFEPDPAPSTVEEYDEVFARITSSPDISIASVAPDCMGQFGQADMYADAVYQELRGAFRANVDWLDYPSLASTSSTRADIEVAIVDSVNDPSNPSNVHGLQMAAIVGDILCPDHDEASACHDQIVHTLALPREDWDTDPDWDDGGHHGSQGDVALAIYEAVRDWKERRDTLPGVTPEHLILNLSVGYNREAPDTVDPTRGADQAIDAALRYASCEGALVFAAAGNNPDEACPNDNTGPLAPAAYEFDRPAPSKTECESLLGRPLPSFPAPGGYRPLVYAVGGVDGHDQPLINSRVGGQPRLVATGSDATSNYKGDPTLYYPALSGTSVAAAVASGAAALAWSYNPSLAAHEIAERLYTSGYATGDYAEFYGSGASATDVRRVSVCSAVRSACVGSVLPCPVLSCVASAPALDANLGDFLTEIDTVTSYVESDGRLHDMPGYVTSETPSCESTDWSDLAAPQPEVPTCSHCTINSPKDDTANNDVVSLAIHPEYKGDVTKVTLVTVDGDDDVHFFDLDSVLTALNSSTNHIVKIKVEAPATIKARLDFELVGGKSQSNPIVVR